MMENHGEGNRHDNNNNNNNDNDVRTTSASAASISSSLTTSCSVSTYVRSRLRLRRIFLVFVTLGYAAITITIYRNIFILVHRGTDSNFFVTTGDIQTYWILALPTTDDDDDDSAVPLNDSTSHDRAPETSSRNHSATTLAMITATTTTTPTKKKRTFKFFVLSIPELTSNLVEKHWDKAYRYGQSTAMMNEDLAEIWLHRGLSNFTYEQGQTMDPKEADVFFIPAYLHGRDSWMAQNGKTTTEQNRKQDILDVILNALIDTTKPHILLIPTRDKSLGNKIGYRLVAQTLWDQGIVPLYSVGFERNSWWQVIPTDRIIPIPYVVKPQVAARDMAVIMFDQANRTENFVFYAAHPRPSAVSFAGCNRSTVLPLQGMENMEILLLSDRQRLSQERYNHRMLTSDYCLVTCGDTPTSRSLASAMVAGCIPLRIGSWWRAICEAPCKKIHMGFNVAAKPHFPFADAINWSLVSPEINQVQFDPDPKATLAAFLQNNTSRAHKDVMRVEMKRVQSSFIYGWGNPINSTQFGDVYKYLWNSIINELQLQESITI